MSSKDILALCAGNLLRRKTRTVLAVIGVIVGVCAIVVMVSIGVALNVGFQDMIEGFGNLHSIQVYSYGQSTGSDGKNNKLDDNTITKLGKLDGVDAITPVIEQYMVIGIGDMKTQASVYGMDPKYIEEMSYDLHSGRSLNEMDADSNVLLFGYNIACWFYNPRKAQSYDWSNSEPTVDVISRDVIVTSDWTYLENNTDGSDSKIEYEKFEFEGVGLLEGTDTEVAYQVFMPIKAMEKIVASNNKAEGQQATTGKTTYNQVLIYVEDIEKIQDICKTIKEDYGFQTYSLTDMLKELQSTANLIEMVLGGIGAVSLLVAAIGIANTMIMSVYERTREIGVMKVIGASLGDIQKMFLMEAGMIGFGGGVVGILLSYGLSFVVNTVGAGLMGDLIGTGTAKASVIPWWLSLGALAFATLVGVVSGWLPAKRAMNLSALEGLKNE